MTERKLGTAIIVPLVLCGVFFATQEVVFAETQPTLDHIQIIPNDHPTRVEVGTDQQFTASALTAANEGIPGVVYTWSVGGNIGYITKGGIFVAERPGTGSVSAVSGTTAATVGVVVKAAPVVKKTVSGNTNTGQNTNVNGTTTTNATKIETTNSNTNASSPVVQETTKKQCSTLRTWVWILLLVAYVILLFAYFLALGESMTAWWWFWPIILTAEMLVLAWLVRCTSSQNWIPVTTVVLGALISWFYYSVFRPKSPIATTTPHV